MTTPLDTGPFRPKYKRVVLDIPSLYQINKKGPKGGSDWCGRTSAAMIYNYYLARKAGGLDAARDSFIINQRESAPHNLVFRDAQRRGGIAADGYHLIGTIRKIKPDGWANDPKGPDVPVSLYPDARRGTVPSEQEVIQILRRVLRSLELYNPVMFYSGLSSSRDTPRHIVVISGYEIGPRGRLWLQIDDPGSAYREKDGQPTGWRLMQSLAHHGEDTEEYLRQTKPVTDFDQPGRRYWIRASQLFAEQHNSKRTDDAWCDHQDRPGFTVWLNDQVPEPASTLAHVVGLEPGLPIDLAGADDDPTAALMSAWRNAASSGSPFPLGSNRTWHDGIHFVYDAQAFASDKVTSFAPGELVMAWFPIRDGIKADSGAVLVKHAFDPVSQRILETGRRVPPGEVQWVYSLSMHLRGGTEGAQALLDRLDIGTRPAARYFVPAGVEAAVVALEPDGSWVHLAAGSQPTDARVDKADTVEVTTDRGPRLALSVADDQTNLRAWERGRPEPTLPPVGAQIGFFDPIRGDVIATALKTTESNRPAMVVTRSRDGKAILETRHHDEAGKWVATDADVLGLMLGGHPHCVHQLRDRARFADAESALLTIHRGTVRLDIAGGPVPRRVTKRFPKGTVLACDANDDDAVVTPRMRVGVAIGPQTLAKANAAIAAGEAPRCWRRGALFVAIPKTADPVRLGIQAGGRWILRVVDGDLVWLDANEKIAEVEGATVTLRRSPATTCVHGPEELAKLANVEDEHWPLLTRSDTTPRAYADTRGRGRGRYFIDRSRVTLPATRRTFPLLDGPRYTAGKLRAWLRLAPCILLDTAASSETERDLARTETEGHGDTLGRLEAGTSALLGIQLSEADGWVVKDGVATARDGLPADFELALYRHVKGRGSGRYFSEKPRDDDQPVITVAPDSGLRLRCVETFRSGGKRKRWRALVEVRQVVPTSAVANNHEAIADWDAADGFRRDLSTRLVGGAPVDLSTAEAKLGRAAALVAGWRNVTRDTIGTLGHIDAQTRGLHFEIFSGRSPVPDGAWISVADDGAHEQLSAEFFRHTAAELVRRTKLQRYAKQLRVPDGRRALARVLEDEPVTPDEWRSLCADPRVARQLSRVVAVHPIEWAVDWDAEARSSRGVFALVQRTLGAELPPGWWPRDLELAGVQGDQLAFVHPLRFIEWLTTGLDVQLDLDGSKDLQLELDLAEGDSFDLRRDPRGDGNRFHLRAVLGDIAPVWDGELVLGGVDTERERIDVRLPRGRRQELWLTEPRTVVSPGRRSGPQSRTVPVYGADVERDDSTKYFLADGNARLDGSLHSRLAIEIAVQYNVEPPREITIDLDGPGFRVERVVVQGAKPYTDGTDGTSLVIPIVPEGPAPRPITMFRRVSVIADVVSIGGLDHTANIQLSANGGDLGTGHPVSVPLATRTIARGHSGSDVAKLQLYLSQIHAGSRPCLQRSRGRRGLVDGGYGKQTSLALWRFLLAHEAGQRRLATVRAQRGQWVPAEFVRPDDLDAGAAALHKQLGGPVIDRAVLDRIVAGYRAPAVLPQLEIDVASPPHDPDVAAAAAKLSPRDRSRVFSVAGQGPGHEVRLILKSLGEADDDLSALTAEATLPETSGLRIAAEHRGPRPLAAMVRDGIRLVSSGQASTSAKHNTLQITCNGYRLGRLRLGGARDLLEGGSGRGLDAACLQAWLGADAAAGYEGKVDGKWGSGSRKALKAYATAHGTTDLEQTLTALRTPAPASTPAADPTE